MSSPVFYFSSVGFQEFMLKPVVEMYPKESGSENIAEPRRCKKIEDKCQLLCFPDLLVKKNKIKFSFTFLPLC